jgi:threonylcarbamoyladenosine tRNA methylthiotransferase MtaB
MTANNKFYIHTLGCKVNQYESQAIREALIGAGFEESPARDGADLFVLNTCTVTERADKESRYLVNVFRRSSPAAKIVVTGCCVEKDAGEFASIPGVTHIVKNSHKDRLTDILSGQHTTYDLRLKTDISSPSKITGFKGHDKAFVKIQDGCDNRCAYCKVPIVRGRSRSRPLRDIVEEVSGLIGNGFKEIVLTGICLGAWGRELDPANIAGGLGIGAATIADLLKALGRIPGDFRIRLSSIEPRYVTDELIGLVRDNRRICRHFHIPLQSGDDDILKLMNRPYTSSEYMALADRIRGSIDGVAITTDLMIGFPGETTARFRRSVDFLRNLSPARTHIFTFSRRPGTAAYDMDGDPGSSELRRRYCEAEGVALNASYLFARSFIGRSLEVLAEGGDGSGSSPVSGYSDNYIKVVFAPGGRMRSRLVRVRITSADPLNATGVPEDQTDGGAEGGR